MVEIVNGTYFLRTVQSRNNRPRLTEVQQARLVPKALQGERRGAGKAAVLEGRFVSGSC